MIERSLFAIGGATLVSVAVGLMCDFSVPAEMLISLLLLWGMALYIRGVITRE